MSHFTQSSWFSRTHLSLLWPAALLGSLGVWSWPAQGDGLALLPSVAALVLSAALGITWLSRVRTLRRFAAVVDAYAERQIYRERLTSRPRSYWTFPRGRGYLDRLSRW
jgi:hypothetical protein